MKKKEALKILKDFHDKSALFSVRTALDTIFPEFKENKDEKVRRWFLNWAQQIDWSKVSSITKEQALAWLKKQNSNIDNANKEYWRGYREGRQEVIDKYAELEKQGKQKPVDKVEPKFSEGDWVTCGDYFRHPLKIVSISNFLYTAVDIQGVSVRPLIEYLDKHYHLFTIQDVNDGDILAFDNATIVIFKDLYNATSFHSYCHIEDGVFNISKIELPDWWNGVGFKPATKEQRDLFFTKMREAGYEWNAERKELKRI